MTKESKTNIRLQGTAVDVLASEIVSFPRLGVGQLPTFTLALRLCLLKSAAILRKTEAQVVRSSYVV